MSRKNIAIILVAFFIAFSSMQVAYAGIKVSNVDCPVFVSSHNMGGQVIQNPNGMYSLNGIITGFAASKFPVTVNFVTLTNFISTARHQPAVNAIVLTDATGKTKLAGYNFNMAFVRPGSNYVQITEWKVSFPSEGFYAFNFFVDGILVGYYPFYVWSNGLVIK